ncbi:hypothetical protein CHUAL_012914 [Chamberlinius hualienensis]
MEKKSSKEWEEVKTLIPQSVVPLYNAPWLNDCSAVLTRPGSHLQKIISKVLEKLVPKLESHISYSNNHQKKQVLYSLLGLRFVAENFNDAEHYDPTVLEKLPVNARETLEDECKASIIEMISRVKESLGFGQKLNRYSPETPLGAFLKESGDVFRSAVERQQLDAKKIKIKLAAKEKSKKKFTFDSNGVEVWETRTDIMAHALVEVTHHEPERLQTLLRSFRELHAALPPPIGNLLKKQFLLRKEKSNLVPGINLKGVEDKWREEFVKTVHRNTTALNVERAIKSPIWQQIDNAVIETYGRVPSLVPYDTNDHQLEASRVLNILQVHSKSFDPILVLWLFPLQITLNSSIQGTDSHVMELAMYLDLVNRHCIPSIDHVFSMADKVVTTWRDWDRGLFSHVQESLSKNVWINIKDFPNQVLHPDRSSANKLSVKMKGRSRNDIPPECLDVFVNPMIFIRKWIIEGFAGILNRYAIQYAWDQLFFAEWNPQALCDICLAILFLLTNRFKKAKNYFGMREVFILDPGRLYASDFRQAHIHVQQGSSFDDIPNMNRKTLTDKSTNQSLNTSDAEKPG